MFGLRSAADGRRRGLCFGGKSAALCACLFFFLRGIYGSGGARPISCCRRRRRRSDQLIRIVNKAVARANVAADIPRRTAPVIVVRKRRRRRRRNRFRLAAAAPIGIIVSSPSTLPAQSFVCRAAVYSSNGVRAVHSRSTTQPRLLRLCAVFFFFSQTHTNSLRNAVRHRFHLHCAPPPPAVVVLNKIVGVCEPRVFLRTRHAPPPPHSTNTFRRRCKFFFFFLK